MAMEKTFNAAEAESRLFSAWEEAGCFTAGANAKPGAQNVPDEVLGLLTCEFLVEVQLIQDVNVVAGQAAGFFGCAGQPEWRRVRLKQMPWVRLETEHPNR